MIAFKTYRCPISCAFIIITFILAFFTLPLFRNQILIYISIKIISIFHRPATCILYTLFQYDCCILRLIYFQIQICQFHIWIFCLWIYINCCQIIVRSFLIIHFFQIFLPLFYMCIKLFLRIFFLEPKNSRKNRCCKNQNNHYR